MNINNYKHYSQIEIDIIPINNIDNIINTKFINIQEKYEPFFHIYILMIKKRK